MQCLSPLTSGVYADGAFMKSTNTLDIAIAVLVMFNMSNLGSQDLLQLVVGKTGRPHMVYKAEARDTVGACPSYRPKS